MLDGILDRFREHSRTKEAEAFVGYLQPEVDFVNALGEIRRSRDSITAEMRDLYSGVFVDIEPSWQSRPPRHIAPMVALVHLRQRLASAVGPLVPEQRFVLRLVLKHDDGKHWLTVPSKAVGCETCPTCRRPDVWGTLAAG